jgi:N-acetyl-anhydromuramyl-L-alanine amidase AmpD
MRLIRHIIIHCSASQNGDARVTRDVIDGWHRERGWNGIGYHYVIETDGEVKVGRTEDRIGAHVEGQNADSIGVCMVGTDRFSRAQWDALMLLVDDLESRYPQADTKGHRDYSPDRNGDGIIEPWEWMKTCPGFDVATWLHDGAPKPENVL